jgi:uncharacterized protein (TIGR00730 family)
LDTTEHLTQHITERRLTDAWAELQNHASNGNALQADAYRLAFADPEFLLRRETRGIRFQLEMLKPDLAQQELGIDNTVVVYGSARIREPSVAQEQVAAAEASGDARAIARARALLRNSAYYEHAREFGRTVARHSARCAPQDKLYICTGGGPGIMEAANRGAHDEGALNVGLNIALPHEQSGNSYITPELSFKFHYFALRKMHFMMRAKALVVFPGGFGTLDELFEVITLVQCQKAKPLPIVLFGSEYWKRLIHLDVLVEEGTVSAEDLKLFSYADDPEAAWSTIQRFYNLPEQENAQNEAP